MGQHCSGMSEYMDKNVVVTAILFTYELMAC